MRFLDPTKRSARIENNKNEREARNKVTASSQCAQEDSVTKMFHLIMLLQTFISIYSALQYTEIIKLFNNGNTILFIRPTSKSAVRQQQYKYTLKEEHLFRRSFTTQFRFLEQSHQSCHSGTVQSKNAFSFTFLAFSF